MISHKAVRLFSLSSMTLFSISSAVAQNHSKLESTEYYDNLSAWVIGRVSRTTTDGVEVSRIVYSSNALPISKYNFGRLERSFSHHADGTLAGAIDGNNNITLFSNWIRGVPTQVRYAATAEAPAGALETASVSVNGWIKSFTDANGFTTSYTHDAMGRLTSINHPTNDDTPWNTETFTFVRVAHDEHGLAPGHWTLMHRSGDKHSNTYYDAMWRPVLEESLDSTDVAGTLTQVVKRYDHDGKEIFRYYPKRWVDRPNESQGSHTQYDALGRVVSLSHDSEHGRLTTSTEYLPGFQTRVTNPKQQQTLKIYQVFDEPVYDRPTGISELGGDRHTEIYRDVLGKVTLLRRRNGDATLQLSRYFVYDAHQRLCKVIEPETGATVMDYDAAGNLQWSAAGLSLNSTSSCDTIAGRDSGRKVTRYYDSRNRIQSIVFPDGRGNQSWEYWPDSLPKRIVTDNKGTGSDLVYNQYAYNKRRLLSSETVQHQGGSQWLISYGFDSNGNVATQSYPSGLIISYAPNALGQATQAQDQSGYYYASGASYHPNGSIKQFTYGNGIVHSMSQNVRQLPARSTDAGVSDLDTRFDANGNISDIYDIQRGAFYNRHMQYDGLDRLTAAGSWVYGGDAWHRFTYDALDNMKSWTLAGVKDYATYVYDGRNQLGIINNSSGASIVGFGYDEQGNVNNKNGQIYRFDYGNRLQEAVGKEAYMYDGKGRRLAAVSGAGIWTQYSLSGQQTYVQNDRNGNKEENIYLAGSIVSTRVWNPAASYTAKFHHTDALGSPIAVTDQAGTVIERNDYEPYGAVIGNPSYQGIGYTGHVQDAATKLTYMQQRYYDPQVGLFLSIDPVTAYSGDSAHFNRYSYAYNNPYTFVDPDGAKGKVAWLVELGTNSMRKIARLTHEQAVRARRAGQNVLGDRRQVSSKIETAAHGRSDQLKHAGHELEDGSKGLPHYQTDGVKGHSFWGKLSAGLIVYADGLDRAAEYADVLDPSTSLTSGAPDLVNHRRTWFGAYEQIDPNGPDFSEADRLRGEELRFGYPSGKSRRRDDD
jgi:RHS repeat-associated protein